MRIFLDVDGVLANFVGGIHRAYGISYDYAYWPYAKGPKGWDFHNEFGMSFSDINKMCDFNFWANLKWTHDGQDILSIVRTFGDITLLTTPMPHVMSASGKMEWIKCNLPQYEKHVLISTESKSVLAQVKDAILVDDHQKNVDDWCTSGGKAVLVPRWWNHRWHEATTTAISVELQLEDICQES